MFVLVPKQAKQFKWLQVLSTGGFFQKVIAITALFSISVFSQDQLSLLIGDIKSCPQVYLSNEASSYAQRTGQTLVSGNKDDALRGYRAAIKLGDLGGAAITAVPVLIEQFPQAIHVSEIMGAKYAGEGTFEDWLSTYVMNEKNKFLLSSPFMDYNNISLCDQYIDAVPKTTIVERQPLNGNTIKSATVDIAITFTVYFGSCALSRITGMTLANNQNDWRIWWAQSGGNGIETGTSANTPIPKIIASGQTFADLVVKAKYRMSLTTGDEFVGVVESKDDTSVIFETVEGKPYIFNKKLIDRCDLVDLPKSLQKDVTVKPDASEPAEETISVSYDSLLLRNERDIVIEVKITTGSLFKGKLVSIDPTTLKLNVDGSIIPITKDVVHSILLVKQVTQKVEQRRAPAAPLDTVIAKSGVVDDWGKAKPDIVCTGTIVKQDDTGISLKRTDSTTQQIKSADIVRVIKHSQNDSNDPIKRYARPLTCPNGMVLVDLPPGSSNHPFFKTCVDKYEYPNKEGTLPKANLSYTEARQLCEKQGKRLCTAEEWQWTCSSLDALQYPYGKTLEENRCNAGGTSIIEASGARINCFSKFGAFDMTGNIFEWVTTADNQPAMMGGPYSKCQAVSPGPGGTAKPLSGVRCCYSN